MKQNGVLLIKVILESKSRLDEYNIRFCVVLSCLDNLILIEKTS